MVEKGPSGGKRVVDLAGWACGWWESIFPFWPHGLSIWRWLAGRGREPSGPSGRPGRTAPDTPGNVRPASALKCSEMPHAFSAPPTVVRHDRLAGNQPLAQAFMFVMAGRGKWRWRWDAAACEAACLWGRFARRDSRPDVSEMPPSGTVRPINDSPALQASTRDVDQRRAPGAPA